MKKTLGIIVIAAVIVMTSGIITAQDEETTIKKGPSQADLLREKTRQQGMQNMDPDSRMERMKERKTEEITKAKKEPEALIATLQSIKEAALKEKATDTAGKIDELIAKTKADMDKKVAAIEERHAKFEEFMEKRADKSTRKTPARGPKSNSLGEEDKAPEEEM